MNTLQVDILNVVIGAQRASTHLLNELVAMDLNEETPQVYDVDTYIVQLAHILSAMRQVRQRMDATQPVEPRDEDND